MTTKCRQYTVLKICHSRNDKWAEVVSGRVASVYDLHAADAIYHQMCSTNFRTGKTIPSKLSVDTDDTAKRSKVGRPEIDERTAAFQKVVEFLEEHDDEQTTITELVLKMTEYLETTEYDPYSARYMKTKIQEQFGDRVIMTVLSTKSVWLHCETQPAQSSMHFINNKNLITLKKRNWVLSKLLQNSL